MLVEKVSNTEKLAGLIIKILKVMGILFIVGFVVIILLSVFFGSRQSSKTEKTEQTVQLSCVLNNEKYEYLIEYDQNDNIIDASGSEYIINIVKDQDFNKAKILVKYIEAYFKDNGGKC